MGSTRRTPEGAARGPQRFTTTRWSLIQAVRQGSEAQARDALATLCALYWYPLYAFVRRQGQGPDDALDRVQGFFMQLLEKNQLALPDPRRGRFRSWLLASLKHYLANERARERALKRGGGQPLFSIDGGDAEARYGLDAADALTPERAFERRWALSVLEHVLKALEDECRQAGRGALFEQLKGTLTGAADEASYREVAEVLGMSQGAIRVAACRLRARYRELLREEIAHTVERPEDVDDELRVLLEALS